MPKSIGDRLRHAWDAFVDGSNRRPSYFDLGPSHTMKPDRLRFGVTNERSIISSIYTRISIDASVDTLVHAKVNERGDFLSVIKGSLNECLILEANLDQTATAFRRDVVRTMLEEGSVAIVPTKTTMNPITGNAFDILELRAGTIVEWFPDAVKVNLWNPDIGQRVDVLLPKKMVAIAENPFYSIMNQPNSTLQRLIRKLSMLDSVDEAASSGKLDVIIQLPYVIRSDTRKQQAENRRKDLEMQLKGSTYGIGYIDGTERITQLNRPAENNLLAQITYLTTMLHGQLGLTEAILDGTADDRTMLNYQNRTIDPILTAVTEAMRARFLTKTARTQGQSVIRIRDPFRFVNVSDLAEIADKMTRNEIMSSNEVRSKISLPPSEDPKADQLLNKNIPPPTEPVSSEPNPLVEEASKLEGELQNGV